MADEAAAPPIAGDDAGTSAGIRAAIADAGPLLPLRDVEQLPLLDQPVRVTGELVAEAPRGRGRPKGARNTRTEAVRAYLLGRFAHPLEVLASFYSRPTDVLAAELGCTKLDAAGLQVKAAIEVAPYVEGKMPVSIDLRQKADVAIIMPGVNAPAGTVREIGEAIVEGGLDAIDWANAQEAEFTPLSGEPEGVLE